MAWCRATYAMEVFASMLNKGDVLQIYPMWPIQVGGKTYTMEAPFQVTDAAQASTIRDIFTANASGTPIESIDCAASGLQKVQADKKYMIVLTDGGTFSKNSSGLSKDRTRKELDNRVTQYAGKSMSVMYLGIGADACMPNTAESEWFVKKQAVNTEDVLSTLTYMCNQIFGRDTLPKSRINGNTIDVDISISKMIIFVQGENISNLKLTGGTVGQQVSSQQTMYSTKGAGDYKSVPDTSLQGMMVTYTDCAAGTYNIEYTGTASSVEVYYEPDADLDFVFTDAEGNTVDPNALYEGDYKVTFGMKDAKTGKLISSDLLGNPKYQGSYFIDGKETPFTHEGFSGSVDVPLKMGEKFEAKLTATYLSGYTITKDSSDFGWPEGGIQVAPKPAGEMKLEISGGAGTYSLLHLEDDEPAVAKVYYQGTQLTGSELEKVELRWDPETSNAEIKKTFADDHWKLALHYKDPAAPQNTVCGECTVTIYAHYSPPGSSEAQTQCAFTYNIKDDFIPLKLELDVPETYIVIKELEESAPITVNFKLNGAPLSAEDFSRVVLQVDCSGIKHTVTPDEQSRSYTIKLLATEGIAEGNYPIKVTAQYTDQVGRETQLTESVTITLSNMALLTLWLLRLGVLAFLIFMILRIMHIRRPPSTMRADTDTCSLRVGGKDVTDDANFYARTTGKQIVVFVEYNAEELGRVSLTKLSPGKESYLYKPSHRRSFLVKFPESVNASGELNSVDVAGIEYAFDNNGTFKPVEEQQAPYMITNGASITINGKIMIAGKMKNFSAEIPLNFKKR
ncbi:MAG: hypothetical protein IKU07_08335 [Oscillospiraceae bacterium]|nr:hypothetical protein [Oscillospiraceae bacterium]